MSLTCPTPDILRKLAFGRVPPDRERELDRHLSACARCRQQHDDHFRPIVAAVRDLSVNRSRGAVATVVADGPPALSATAAESDLGSLGKFRLLEVMGEGGMGRVYRARDTSLNREVALKVILLRGRSAATADQRRGLFAEAQAAAKLDDPNIVPVFEVGEISDTPYLVMPLLKGETLGGCLRRGALPLYEVCRIGSQIARGLSVAHAAGLVHRDIKPGNIWLEPRAGGAAVRILDFGLAQTLTEATAGLAGTPAYMAPEQAAGRAVDARADLFGLGVVLFEMASGKRLFPGGASSMAELLASVQKFDSPSGGKLLPTVPPRLSGVIAGLLRNDPQRRTPDDAEELSDTLTALAAEFDPARRRKQLLGLVRTAAVIAASGLVVLGGVWAKKEFLDAPVSLTRVQKLKDEPPAVRTELSSVPKGVIPPAITADRRLENLDHLSRAQIEPAVLTDVGEGDPNRVAPEVVAVFSHPGFAEAVALHPKGALLATGGTDNTVHLWDLAASPPKVLAVLTNHTAPVNALAFTSDGSRLVSGALDGAVVVWSFGTEGAGPVVHKFEVSTAVTRIGVGRGNLVAVGDNEGVVHLFDVRTGAQSGSIRGNRSNGVVGLAFAPDDKRLVIGSNGFLRFADLADAKKEPRNYPESKVWFSALSVSPDGANLLANGFGVLAGGRPLELLPGFGNNREAERQNALSVRPLSGEPVAQKVLRHAERVRRAEFRPDGRHVVSLTYDAKVHLWDWAAEVRLASVPLAHVVPENPALARDMVLHPDGRHAIVSRPNSQILIVRFQQK